MLPVSGALQLQTSLAISGAPHAFSQWRVLDI